MDKQILDDTGIPIQKPKLPERYSELSDTSVEKKFIIYKEFHPIKLSIRTFTAKNEKDPDNPKVIIGKSKPSFTIDCDIDLSIPDIDSFAEAYLLPAIQNHIKLYQNLGFEYIGTDISK